MIPFLDHPYLYSLQDWLLVALAMFAYFNTGDFTKNPEHKGLDMSWKITTALMWPICFLIVAAVVIFTVIGTLFGKKPGSKSKKD